MINPTKVELSWKLIKNTENQKSKIQNMKKLKQEEKTE